MPNRHLSEASRARRCQKGEPSNPILGEIPAPKSSNQQSKPVMKASQARAEIEPAHFLSVKEVAAMLGIGRHRMARALRAQQITGVKIGSRFVIRVDEARRMLGDLGGEG